jgi:hypothetical protein
VARLLFPERAARLVVGTRGAGAPLIGGVGVRFHVWADAAGTQPADILDLDEEPIADSIIRADADALLPVFLGPHDAVEVYIQQVGSGRVPALLRPAAGSGAVESVNGQSGHVVLSAAGLGAMEAQVYDPTGKATNVFDISNHTGVYDAGTF